MQQHNQRMGQEQAGDEVDRMLDAALKQYASVEPREGLEDRLLAQLRSESLNSPSRTWWRWGIAAAAGCDLRYAPGSHMEAAPAIARHSDATLCGIDSAHR